MEEGVVVVVVVVIVVVVVVIVGVGARANRPRARVGVLDRGILRACGDAELADHGGAGLAGALRFSTATATNASVARPGSLEEAAQQALAAPPPPPPTDGVGVGGEVMRAVCRHRRPV